jgi:hypothetical protein
MVASQTITHRVEGAEQVIRDLQRAGKNAKPEAAKLVRAVSFGLERRIKVDMPVDEGRARASWGHWTQGDLVTPDAAASEADSHWIEHDGGMTIEQGSNVEYIQALNDGHSQQAPAGFIDKAVAWAQRVLVDEIDKMLKRLF